MKHDPDTRNLPRGPAERRSDPQDDTKVSDAQGEPAPRLPHEHDQSADSTAAEPQPRIRQAKEDIDRGLVDTDRGTPMHETYKQQKR